MLPLLVQIAGMGSHVQMFRSCSSLVLVVSTGCGGASPLGHCEAVVNSAVALADPVRLARWASDVSGGGDECAQVRPDYGTKARLKQKLSALSPAGSTPSGTAIR